MTSPLVNGLLTTLSVFASGYLIYAAPVWRFLWVKLPGNKESLDYESVSGYDLYFRIIATGLALLYVCHGLIFFITTLDSMPSIFDFIPSKISLEHAPLATFLLALSFWVASHIGILFVDIKLRRRLKLKEGLEHFIYDRAVAEKPIMVTLENNKVYVGWPIAILKNKTTRWLRIIPTWSGYRNDKSVIKVTVDYSKVYDEFPLEKNHMLIAVDTIFTIQPFDVDVFNKLNY